MVYAYEEDNPQYRGLLKVGYTTIDVNQRVAQQYPTKRPDGKVPIELYLLKSAMYSDGGSFTDHDFHKSPPPKSIKLNIEMVNGLNAVLINSKLFILQ